MVTLTQRNTHIRRKKTSKGNTARYSRSTATVHDHLDIKIYLAELDPLLEQMSNKVKIKCKRILTASFEPI